MKFVMKKHVLSDALDKMHRIATKGIKAEYDGAGKVTIEVAPDKVEFRTSNGHLFAKWEVTKETDSTVQGSDPGEITADVNVLRNVCNAAGTEDSALSVSIDNNVLLVKDMDAKRGGTRRAKLETSFQPHNFKIKKSPKGFAYEFDTAIFRDGVSSVGRYVSPFAYKIKYQMICLHFLKDEMRFICGDGMRFAIRSFKDSATEEGKYIMPADQAGIICSVLGDAQKVKITYENEQSCYISPFNGMEMHLKGIPNQKYIAYETHACDRDDDIEAIIRISREEFVQGMALVNSVRDKAAEQEGDFASAVFEAGTDQEFALSVDEGRNQCEFTYPCEFESVKKSRKSFKSMYASQFLTDVAEASSGKGIIEFSCIDEHGTLLAEPKDEGSTADNRIWFFFASALDAGDDD